MTQGVTLNARLDPHQALRKMSGRWRIDHVIPTAACRANGQNIEISNNILREGDFVEVLIAVGIEVIRMKKKWGTVVHFTLQEVVRLWTMAEVKVSEFLHVRILMETKQQHTGAVQCTYRSDSGRRDFEEGSDAIWVFYWGRACGEWQTRYRWSGDGDVSMYNGRL